MFNYVPSLISGYCTLNTVEKKETIEMLEEVWVVEHVLRMYEALNLIPRTAGIPKHSVHSPSGFQELPAQA